MEQLSAICHNTISTLSREEWGFKKRYAEGYANSQGANLYREKGIVSMSNDQAVAPNSKCMLDNVVENVVELGLLQHNPNNHVPFQGHFNIHLVTNFGWFLGCTGKA